MSDFLLNAFKRSKLKMKDYIFYFRCNVTYLSVLILADWIDFFLI